jgi:hypothetical protein
LRPLAPIDLDLRGEDVDFLTRHAQLAQQDAGEQRGGDLGFGFRFRRLASLAISFALASDAFQPEWASTSKPRRLDTT